MERCGSTVRMDEEMYEKIIVASTQAAMMMEELSAKALEAATMKPDELEEWVRGLRTQLAAVLCVLDGQYLNSRNQNSRSSSIVRQIGSLKNCKACG